MRLFIAIPLSDAMKDALTAVQDEMYDNGVRGNFTSRENMHLPYPGLYRGIPG